MIANKADEPAAAENEVLDLLDRQEFVSKLIDILDFFSKHKKSCSFAIAGQWGAGKTFVIEKLEKQISQIISEEINDTRYIVFHYNCWQYDYYDEPAIAIISAMLDYTSQRNGMGKGARRAWDVAKSTLLNVVGEITKNKLGTMLLMFKGS
jgi:Cdc6-like AAA superfamily ATPase